MATDSWLKAFIDVGGQMVFLMAILLAVFVLAVRRTSR